MKKVWILEKWVNRNDCEDTLNKFKELLTKEELKDNKTYSKVITRFSNYLADPEFKGYWVGYVGKSKYSDFCYEAADFIRRHKADNYKLRVVSAYIEDESTSWSGYKNPTENEGVLKYLYLRSK